MNHLSSLNLLSMSRIEKLFDMSDISECACNIPDTDCLAEKHIHCK